MVSFPGSEINQSQIFLGQSTLRGGPWDDWDLDLDLLGGRAPKSSMTLQNRSCDHRIYQRLKKGLGLKMWCIPTMKQCSALKREEILAQASTWVNLEDIMLSETSQLQRTNTVWAHLYEAPRVVKPTDREQKGGCQGWGERALPNYRFLASKPGIFLKFRLLWLRGPGVPEQTKATWLKTWAEKRVRPGILRVRKNGKGLSLYPMLGGPSLTSLLGLICWHPEPHQQACH